MDALDSAFGLPADACTWNSCCTSQTLLLASLLPPFIFFCFLLAFAFQIVMQEGCKCPSRPIYNPQWNYPWFSPALHSSQAVCICYLLHLHSSSGTAAWRNFSSNPYVEYNPLLIQSSQKTDLLRRKAKVTLSHSCKQIHTKVWWSFQKCQEVNSNQLYLCRHVKKPSHVVSPCVLGKKGREEEKPLQRTNINPFLLKTHRNIEAATAACKSQ